VGPKRSEWIAGDVNGDLLVDIGDLLFLINYLFKGGPVPHPLERGDITLEGDLTLLDILYLISYLYRGGPSPPSAN